MRTSWTVRGAAHAYRDVTREVSKALDACFAGTAFTNNQGEQLRRVTISS